MLSGLKIILQQRMDFVTSEAWARRLKAFSEGQKIPSTSLGKTFLKCLVTSLKLFYRKEWILSPQKLGRGA